MAHCTSFRRIVALTLRVRTAAAQSDHLSWRRFHHAERDGYFGCVRRQRFGFAFILVALALTTAAFAQPRPGYMPSSTHIFPAGAQRGTSVRVRVGAECIPPGTNFFIDGYGVHAPQVLGARLPDTGEPSPRRVPTEIPITFPREWESQIDIAVDATVGSVPWRLSCAQGGTGSRPFIIGELPEVIEKESNSSSERAEQITLPVTVNGQISGERDTDYYRFSASPGKAVVCEVIAGRIGSRLDPVVDIVDHDGHPVIAERRYIGSDPVLAFCAETSDPYTLRIANVSLHGSPAHVYRINLTMSPYLRVAFPAGGQAGSEPEVEFVAMTGTNSLPTPLSSIRRRVTFPTTRIDSFELRDAEFANGVSLLVDDLPNLIEREPNHRDGAMDLSLPVSVHGRLADSKDEDWFVFSAVKDERLAIECRTVPLGSQASPTFSLLEGLGQQLAQARAVDGPDGLARLDWRSPADGRYRLRVRDLQFGSAGGEDFIYRLSIRRSQPDFDLSLAADCVNVMQGGTTTVDINVRRLGGFDGPIDLQWSDLPQEVQCDTLQIPANAANIKVNLKASADAAATNYTLQLRGRATIDNRQVEHLARARHQGVDTEGVGFGSPTLDRVYLTVQHKPIFRLFCNEAYMYAHRGTVYPYLMEVERLDGFDGPITLQIGDRQNRDLDGIEMREVVFEPGQTQIRLPIYLPETMHINVQSQSQLYSQAYASFRDKHQRQQSVLVLSEKRNMLRTLPPVVKLKAVDDQLTMGPSGDLTCRFRIERTSNYPGPLQLELLDASVPDEVHVKPVSVAAGQTEVTINLGHIKSPSKQQTLRFRATGKMNDETLVISEDDVSLMP